MFVAQAVVSDEMSSSGGNEEEQRKKTEALFNKIVTSAKKKIEETEKVFSVAHAPPALTCSPTAAVLSGQRCRGPAVRRACKHCNVHREPAGSHGLPVGNLCCRSAQLTAIRVRYGRQD